MMNPPAFPVASLEHFSEAYPDSILKLKHEFLGHPLMELPALVELSQRLPASVIEHNVGALPIGIGQHDVPKHRLTVAETIASIENNDSWIVLKNIELDPTYRQLLHDVLAEISPAVEAHTGPMLNLVGFIFISSPNAVTPFHSDPEYNILLQTRGEKTMTLFSGTDESIIPPEFHEIYHAGGPRTVPWKEEFAPKGMTVTLRAGDAVYVPLKWPHHVKNGPELSISLSVTWRSHWSYAEADTRTMNKILRNIGFKPTPPRPLPHQNLVKSTVWRALRKVGVRA
jgi:hypothetical protein